MMTWKRAARVIAGLAASAALTACGSVSLAGTRLAGTASPGPGRPGPAVVSLTARFSPSSVRLRAGQQFLVVVSPGVKANGIPWPGACPAGTVGPVAGGLLTARCEGGGRYLYTAQRPGSTIVSATVGPHCAPGQMCPTWMAAARLTVTIS